MDLPTAPQIPATRRRTRSSSRDIEKSTFRGRHSAMPIPRPEPVFCRVFPVRQPIPRDRSCARVLFFHSMRPLALLAVVLALLAWPANALAHQVGLSTGDYVAHGSTVVVKLAFARNE